MGLRRLHLLVTGRVQGVGYRANTRHVARKLGLAGWVKNREDGSVEALAEGEETTLQELLAWCRRGPPAARVTEVRADWSEPTGEFSRFEVTF